MEMPMHPIRIAAHSHPQQGAWRELRAGAIRAEALGYDIVCTWNHFFPLRGNADGFRPLAFALGLTTAGTVGSIGFVTTNPRAGADGIAEARA
jgi:alkanesulfonate monooxygenase SsuD/methylene tetrahydromethanopterin reductase-like flavin-dependent oxidoreductase (luciferase family)